MYICGPVDLCVPVYAKFLYLTTEIILGVLGSRTASALL
jgi:hypothetical protein